MLAQILATTIFIAMFILIVMEKWERHIITLVSALLTLILVFGVGMHSLPAIIETLNVHSIITPDFWISSGESSGHSSGINWETIVFIFGMMIMVEGMAHTGFFRWLCMKIAFLVKCKTIPIFITFMIMSAVLSMFMSCVSPLYTVKWNRNLSPCERSC